MGLKRKHAPPARPIELRSTDDLLSELFGRFDACVFAGTGKLTVSGLPAYDTQRTAKGPTVLCAGLAGMLMADITAHLANDPRTPLKGDELAEG